MGNLDGGIAVTTNKFTVAAASGNTVVDGTLAGNGGVTSSGLTASSPSDLTLAAAGTNQDVSITPVGTGVLSTDRGFALSSAAEVSVSGATELTSSSSVVRLTGTPGASFALTAHTSMTQTGRVLFIRNDSDSAATGTFAISSGQGCVFAYVA